MSTTLAPMTTNQSAQITRAAIAALREAVRGDQTLRTARYRQVADLLIDLRALFVDSEGNTDWAGRSFDYRAAVRDIYSGAGLGSESNDPHKAALRYHIGNALRERLTPEQLDEAGLTAANPRNRQLARHQEDSGPRPATELVAQLAVLIERLQGADNSHLTKRDFNVAQRAARDLEKWLDAQRMSR